MVNAKMKIMKTHFSINEKVVYTGTVCSYANVFRSNGYIPNKLQSTVGAISSF
jgi:hypothetical protein